MNTVHNAVRSTPAARAIARGSLIAALALSLAPLVARAERIWTNATAAGNLVDVRVLVSGRAAPLFPAADGSDRLYLQAFKGRAYSLVVHNRSGERVGVLIAVDGLNVVNGERTSLAAGEPMYILGPWETATIRGWRTSLDNVRQFVFVDEERSYASRTDQANGDMGWIRVLSFRENRPLAWGGIDEPRRALDRDERSKAQAATPEAGAPQKTAPRDQTAAPETRAQNDVAPQSKENFPGTGWGDQRYDPVRRVEFNAERYATDHLVLRYEYESGLRALGIFPDRGRRLWDRDNGQLGFAQPPRW